MKLRGTEFKRMHEAFLGAFRSENEIERLLRFNLDTSLADVPKGDSFSDLIFNLIEWAERTGKLDKLLEGVIKERSTNAAIYDLRNAIVERERHEYNVVQWFVESFTGAVGIEPFRTYVRERVDFDYGEAAEKYRKKLKGLYSKQRMLGKSDEVTISDLFTEVYMLDQRTALRRFSIERLRAEGESHGDKLERRSGSQLVMSGKNFYILGKPGAGKTTFLKYLTMRAANHTFPKVPIFVSLNDWSNSLHGRAGHEALMPYIIEQFGVCRFQDSESIIENLVESGRALVLFDGLDEVKQEKEQRRTLTRLLQDFATKYNKCQCLITCRIAASDYMFKGFRDVEVADFTPKQVETYAEKWFAEFPHKLNRFKRDLAKEENEGLAELCCSPLLLGMLCLYFDDAQEFPKRRAELYEEAIEALLKRWDSSRDIQRDYQVLSARRKQQMFAAIAAQIFEENEYLIEQKRLVKLIEAYLERIPDIPDEIDGDEVLKAIEAQHGIFVERAKGIYSFAHLTFQEYFAARYIVEGEARGTTKNLVKKHLTDLRWREVFLLTADMLEDANDFVAQIRRQVDSYVRAEPNLVGLLIWVEGKTQRAISQAESELLMLRTMYLSFAVARANCVARSLEIFLDRVLEDVRVRLVALTYSLISPPVSANLKITLNRFFWQGRALTDALEVAQRIEIDFDKDSIVDFEDNAEVDFDDDSNLNSDDAQQDVPDDFLDFGFNRNQYDDFDLDGDLDFGFELGHYVNKDIGVDFGLLFVWFYAAIFGVIEIEYREPFVHYMYKYAETFDTHAIRLVREQIDAPKLCKILENLTVPTGQNDQATWQEFAGALAEILTEQRDFDFERKITREQWEKMNTYFAANERLLQCLDLATVSDRMGIKAGLLLPPKV